MAYKKQLLYETLRSIDSATFTGSFQAVGTPLLHPATIVRVVNTSGETVTVSVDGVNAHDAVATDSSVEYNITSNTPGQGVDGIFFPQGTQFYVSGAASTGLVYIVVLYIPQV